jgi:phosphoribosyl 1,2-cyclic phosphodiesterase
MRKQTRRSPPVPPVRFEVWGCRGSRNLVPPQSRIGNRTSCYSLRVGEDVIVFDAGRGLAALSHALRTEAVYRGVRQVLALVSHAHSDHWEGLRDADWFWHAGSGVAVRVVANAEALGAIRAGYRHPSYVALELLAATTRTPLAFETLATGGGKDGPGWVLRTAALNHYSGNGSKRRRLDTMGFQVSVEGGPTVAYLSDHEPTPRTARTEQRLTDGAHLVLFDAHFGERHQQMHGHGSQEHAASVARRRPELLVLAGHHGPALTDGQILAARRRHAGGLRNYALAIEGVGYEWDPRAARFRRRPLGA